MDGPGPSDPPPERPPRAGVFEPAALTDDHPRLTRWALVVAVALAIVLVKPWDLGDALSTPGDQGRTAAATRGPSLVPTATPDRAEALVETFCLDRGRWLIASIERWRDQTIRVWRALDPATAASGPEDPAIPVMPVVSEGVLELGWCAPSYGDERPIGHASIATWRISGTATHELALMRGRPSDAATPFGALYAAPRRPLSSRSATWPEGRYVFRHRTDDGAERWFSIDVVNRAAVEPAS